MLTPEVKKFIEDYMTFSCKYCWDIKNFACDKIYTKCLDKSLYLAIKMTEKGWKFYEKENYDTPQESTETHT